jgi:hypothetical protein
MIVIVIISTISIIVAVAPVEQTVNAATRTRTTTNSNTINCQSKTGTASTNIFGTLGYAGGQCTGENGGTVAAGGIKSNSGAVGIHGVQGPNGNSHVGGFRR